MKTIGYLIHFLLFGALSCAGAAVIGCAVSFVPLIWVAIFVPELSVPLWFECVGVACAVGTAMFLIGHEARGNRMFE